MAGCICKCHCQIVIPGHSPGPGTRHSSRLRELGHVLNVERENLVSEVSPHAVISRIFHGLEDPIGILDAATDTMSQTYTHTYTHISRIPSHSPVGQDPVLGQDTGTGPCAGKLSSPQTLISSSMMPHLERLTISFQ